MSAFVSPWLRVIESKEGIKSGQYWKEESGMKWEGVNFRRNELRRERVWGISVMEWVWVGVSSLERENLGSRNCRWDKWERDSWGKWVWENKRGKEWDLDEVRRQRVLEGAEIVWVRLAGVSPEESDSWGRGINHGGKESGRRWKDEWRRKRWNMVLSLHNKISKSPSSSNVAYFWGWGFDPKIVSVNFGNLWSGLTYNSFLTNFQRRISKKYFHLRSKLVFKFIATNFTSQ
jgi:hypothetical protein